MHDVWLEAGQDALHACHRAAGDPDVGVPGEGDGRDALNSDPVHGVHGAQGSEFFVGRCDDHGFVTLGPEVLQDSNHGMRHAVDVGEELFGNHCDSHN